MTGFRTWRLPAFALALGGVIPAVQAADETGKWYIAPQVGYTITDHIRAVDNDVYYGLAIGKHVSEAWSAELSLDRGTYHGPGGSKLDLSTISLDTLRVFARRARMSPYLTGGVGYANDDFNPGPSRGDFLGQVGAGLLIDVAANPSGSFAFQLRPEVKARWDWNDVGRGRPVDYLAGVTFVLAFGPGHKPWVPGAREPAASPPPAPPTPPVSQSAPAPTPPPPAPPAAPPSSIVLSGVNFAFNSAQLAASAHPILDRLAQDLQHPGNQHITVEVQGHTDNVGKPDYNLRLSQHRAEAVKDYLVTRGVAASRISAKGYGETQPIANNRTDQGRAQNRRVVINVINNPDKVKVIGEATH
jgi:OOP family OmpA-OmpF porin